MDSKPYILEAPRQLLMQYGYNLENMAKAAAAGIADPTAVVLAGMLKQRGDAEAQKAQVPQQTIAQQVFAPPAGLGATPQAAAMPPMNAAPPMGMPAPQGEMPMMAEGGMVPPYMAGGGLSDLPVPDGMFDEPSNGGYGDGYAGGGIVAFFEGGPVEGGPVKEKTPEEIAADEAEKAYLARLDKEYVPPASANNTIVVSGQGPAKAPEPAKAPIPFAAPEFTGIPAAMYGMSGTAKDNLATIKALAPQQTKYSERLTKELEKSLDEKEQKKRVLENLDMAMIRMGVKMAQTPGSILQSALAGAGEAQPGFEAGVKEQRAEARDAVKALAEQEGISNKAAREAANLAMEMTMKYGTIAEAMKDRAVQIELAKRSDDVQLLVAQIQAATARAGQRVQLQVANAPTGTERLARLAQNDPTFKTLLQELGVFGGSTTSGANSSGDDWTTPLVVNPTKK
jgi:hypothetical protein